MSSLRLKANHPADFVTDWVAVRPSRVRDNTRFSPPIAVNITVNENLFLPEEESGGTQPWVIGAAVGSVGMFPISFLFRA